MYAVAVITQSLFNSVEDRTCHCRTITEQAACGVLNLTLRCLIETTNQQGISYGLANNRCVSYGQHWWRIE